MTTIFLMRHGETEWNRAERMQGQIECPLNDSGRRQAAETGKRFAREGVRFTRVISSTLCRAVETAAIVSGVKREAVSTDADLMEMGFGPYEGVHFSDLTPDMFVFFGDPEHVPAPDGMETIPHMKERVGRFLERLRLADPGGTLLVVAHGVTMRILLGLLMDDCMAGWTMPLENCCVYCTVLQNGNYSLPERAMAGEETGSVEERAQRVMEQLRCLNTARRPLIVAIDGRCGAGKTTLAAALEEKTGYPVVHMDDFFPRPFQRTAERLAIPGGNVDYERFTQEVLGPLRAGESAFVRPYNCRTGEIGEPIPVPNSPVFIVEGSYSCHPALWDSYDLRVFLDVDPSVQMKRITERNGQEKAKEFKSRWIPLEEHYFAAAKIAGRCELYIN